MSLPTGTPDISYLQITSQAAKTVTIRDPGNDGSRSHRGDHGGSESSKDRPLKEGPRSGMLKSQRKLENFADRRGMWEKRAKTPGSAEAVLPENQPRSRYRQDMGAKAAAARLAAREAAAKVRAERRAGA